MSASIRALNISRLRRYILAEPRIPREEAGGTVGSLAPFEGNYHLRNPSILSEGWGAPQCVVQAARDEVRCTDEEMRGLPRQVRMSLEKARDSALLAVEVYNKPAVKFKSGGYICLMAIAWTALFHAVFFRKKIKPFRKKKAAVTSKSKATINGGN